MQKSGRGGCDTRETTPLKRQRAPSVRRCGMCLGVVSTVMTTRTHARPQTKEEEDEGKKTLFCVCADIGGDDVRRLFLLVWRREAMAGAER